MNKNLNILVVESNRYHGLLLKKEVFQKYPRSTVELIRTGSMAINALSQKRYDVAVIDFCELADIEGLQLLELIRKEDIDLPVIVVDNNDSGQVASEAIKSGAAEYLVKDNAFQHTVVRVIAEVCRRRLLVVKNRALEEKLKEKQNADVIKLAAGTLSHEINNPLMAILGISELLLSSPETGDKELIRKVRIIQRSARRIRSSLDRLRSLSHPIIKETASGRIIDSGNPATRRRIRSKVKFSKNFS